MENLYTHADAEDATAEMVNVEIVTADAEVVEEDAIDLILIHIAHKSDCQNKNS
jgi:hydrogenase maturation factor